MRWPLLGTQHQVVVASDEDMAGFFLKSSAHGDANPAQPRPRRCFCFPSSFRDHGYKVYSRAKGKTNFSAAMTFSRRRSFAFWARQPDSTGVALLQRSIAHRFVDVHFSRIFREGLLDTTPRLYPMHALA